MNRVEQMELFIFHRIAAYTCRWNSIHRGCVMSQSTSDILFDELNARCHATIMSATVLHYTVKYNYDTKDFVASVLINVLTRCLIAIDCPTWLTTRYVEFQKVSKHMAHVHCVNFVYPVAVLVASLFFLS